MSSKRSIVYFLFFAIMFNAFATNAQSFNDVIYNGTIPYVGANSPSVINDSIYQPAISVEAGVEIENSEPKVIMKGTDSKSFAIARNSCYASIFLPYGSQDEVQSFISNHPNCVSLTKVLQNEPQTPFATPTPSEFATPTPEPSPQPSATPCLVVPIGPDGTVYGPDFIPPRCDENGRPKIGGANVCPGWSQTNCSAPDPDPSPTPIAGCGNRTECSAPNGGGNR